MVAITLSTVDQQQGSLNLNRMILTNHQKSQKNHQKSQKNHQQNIEVNNDSRTCFSF